MHPKPVRFVLRLGPNFFWHMLAVGRIGYDSEYADTWAHTVEMPDRERLHRHRHQLTFGEGSGGDLSAFFATFAGACPIESKEELMRYFDVLEQSFLDDSLARFAEAYPAELGDDPFFRGNLKEGRSIGNTESLLPVVKELSEVYLRSLDPYVERVWPAAQRAMQPRRQALERQFTERDYIAAWENFLNRRWQSDRYDICLCFANKNGPDYNSLGYSGNLFYYDKAFDRTWQFVSHEIGTHLLIGLFMDISREGEYDFRELYAAFECLAMFYNRNLLGVDELAYEIPQFESVRRLADYERLYKDGMDPATLLRQALTESQK